MRKQLNESAVATELRDGSAFFQRDAKPQHTDEPAVSDTATRAPRNRGVVPPRNHATTQPSLKAAEAAVRTEQVIGIRKVVKQIGKEAATYRITPDEKRAIADIVYSYKTTGLRTSENEITRIAINYLLDDYRTQGNQSVLAQVLELLRE
jgi:hypothetical protein